MVTFLDSPQKKSYLFLHVVHVFYTFGVLS